MTTKFRFDPDRVAYYEKAGWQAYYDRQWWRVLVLMVQLNRAQFAMPWTTALAAALDVVAAARAFAPVDNDLAKTKQHLAAFYTKARRSVTIAAEAATLADLELTYWVVHRQLAIQRRENPAAGDIEPMVAALASLHEALFGGEPATMRTSAEWRARAAATVDRITSKQSTDEAADWRAIEQDLQHAYRAIQG